jgi:uncharacterized protein DUF5994
MTSVPSHPADPEADSAELPSRVHLKPATPDPGDPGYVDGAWWPRSRDLTAELPALFAALAARLGVIERMAYHLGEWQSAIRLLQTGTTRVKLGGFRFQGANTVDIVGSGSHRITLLVVPPETAPENAEKIALAAADGHNLDTVDHLLARVAGRNGMPRPRPE